VLSLPVNSSLACSAGVSGGRGVIGLADTISGFVIRGDVRLTGDDTRREPGSGLRIRASIVFCGVVVANCTVARRSTSRGYSHHTTSNT
jgi:hypothetical protein